MIPVQLKLSGFLSYRDPVTVDFTTFELACISGANGAGKSSLLDAITWSLFGKARQDTEGLINAAADTAEVALTFQYEENTYKVIRSLPRGKTGLLEFQIKEGERWRPLTEKSKAETQKRIISILRLDYETFINASFFLQGKADQFSQQKSSDRKRILGSILGLEIWETYRERTAQRRKEIENEITKIDGRLEEIEQELSEDAARKQHLKELQKQLAGLTAARMAQDKIMESLLQIAANIKEQKKLVETHANQLERLRQQKNNHADRLTARTEERNRQLDLIKHARDLEKAYLAWQAARATVEQFEQVANQFREYEKRRQPLVDEINIEKARLEQELTSLTLREEHFSQKLIEIEAISSDLTAAKEALTAVEEQMNEIKQQKLRLEEINEALTSLNAENALLKQQMNPLRERRDALKDLQECPLCGQPLTEEHLSHVLTTLEQEGKPLGDKYRANVETISQLDAEKKQVQFQPALLQQAEAEQKLRLKKCTELETTLQANQKEIAEWQKTGLPRLKEVKQLLEEKSFAANTQQKLKEIDAELVKLGYNPVEHENARQAELAGRAVEADYVASQSAKAALVPIEDEISNLKKQLKELEKELDQQETQYAQSAAMLAKLEEEQPNLEEAEKTQRDLREQENQLMNEVGQAQQRVNVLTSRREQKLTYTVEREERARQVNRHKTLERAFSKDGIPAILIEQALPEIELKANELLDRLSNGNMSVRFITQATYKDKKRDDLKETLDIQISDSAGTRDYDMFSGGEAFRANFAIRLALSELLARRAGARLQTLVIDEGFGTQDPQGRQRLIEAINMVKADFEKILIITHLEELKEAFPNRIEVEKTPNGSTVRVL